MTDDMMTIRQMCDAFDVTPRTLRFYESRELLSPLRRGQHRLYDRRDRGRLKSVECGAAIIDDDFELRNTNLFLDLQVNDAWHASKLLAQFF